MDMDEQRWEALTEGFLGAILEVAQAALPVSYKGYKRGGTKGGQARSFANAAKFERVPFRTLTRIRE